MEHRSSVIVLRSNAIDNNNDDEKMIPNDVNEVAEDSLQERSSKENSLQSQSQERSSEGDSSKERSSEEGCSQDNTTSSTSVYVDYLKCIFVPETLVPMLSWQIQEIVVKFNLHKKESKLLPIEQMFPKKELFFREERVLKNERATL